MARRTVKGMFWAYGAYVGGRALVLVSTAVLARLLTPADFGEVALALVFMVFLDTVRDLGLTQALIGSSDGSLEEETQTVFVGTVALGATLALGAAAIGPIAAGLLDHPELAALLPVLASNFFLQSLGATHDALIRKRLDYRARTVAESADVISRGLVGIALAFAGAGVWSLVIGYVVGTIARDIALWSQVSWRPTMSFPRTHLRRLVRFGGVLTLVDIGSAIIHNIDYLFIGSVLGSSALGLYTIGFRLPELLILNLAIVAGEVLFPAYAALDRSDLRAGYLVSLKYITVLILPMAVALVVLAEPTVLTLFGDKFEGSVPVMRVLAVFAVLATINIPAGTIYKVTGRGGILLYTTFPYLAAVALTLWLVADEGIVAVGLAVAGCQALFAVVSLVIASRILNVGTREIGRAMMTPVLGSAAMALVLLALVQLISSDVAVLLVGGLLGAGTYLGVVFLLDPEVLNKAKEVFKPASVQPPSPLTPVDWTP